MVRIFRCRRLVSRVRVLRRSGVFCFGNFLGRAGLKGGEGLFRRLCGALRFLCCF